VCPTCGLPKELCVCETIAKEQQKITIKTDRRRYGKLTTVVQGIDSKEIDIKDLGRKLKNKLACGGTVKENRIELQGDHRRKVKVILTEMGFPADTIVIT